MIWYRIAVRFKMLIYYKRRTKRIRLASFIQLNLFLLLLSLIGRIRRLLCFRLGNHHRLLPLERMATVEGPWRNGNLRGETGTFTDSWWLLLSTFAYQWGQNKAHSQYVNCLGELLYECSIDESNYSKECYDKAGPALCFGLTDKVLQNIYLISLFFLMFNITIPTICVCMSSMLRFPIFSAFLCVNNLGSGTSAEELMQLSILWRCSLAIDIFTTEFSLSAVKYRRILRG